MITGVIKNKIDKIWEDIWAGGLTMPFKVIEQITYLMFIRKLDEKEIDNEKRANSLRRRNDFSSNCFWTRDALEQF